MKFAVRPESGADVDGMFGMCKDSFLAFTPEEKSHEV